MDTTTPQTYIPTRRDRNGYVIEGSRVQWWGRKTEAVAGALAIGWPASSVTRVHTRFGTGYALSQNLGLGLVTPEWYAELIGGKQ